MIKLLFLSVISLSSLAHEPNEISFYNFSGGNYLELSTDGSKNSIQFGSGENYAKDQAREFESILLSRSPQIQWELRDLTNNKIINKSNSVSKLFYGASLSKIFVASAFFNQTADEDISSQSRQELSDLIVKSSNSAWTSLQIKVGLGDEDLGKREIQSFLNSLCIYDSIGYRGYLGNTHGNEINVSDVSTFIQSSFNQEYLNSNHLFKLLFISKTGKSRLKKYFSNSMIIGGKTGTYKGNTSINGKRVVTDSNHHMIVFKHRKKYYSMVVLSDGVAQEKLSVLAFGLFKKYIK